MMATLQEFIGVNGFQHRVSGAKPRRTRGCGGIPMDCAIYALATSLALLGHTDNTERAASFFEGRPCTRSRFTWILRAYMALCALVIPVLGYIGRGWLDGVIYLIYAILILCCHYRAEELRRLNATEARVDCLSREDLATATTEGNDQVGGCHAGHQAHLLAVHRAHRHSDRPGSTCLPAPSG
ncbi:g8402 [Coccomyxa viridis]|uniref:G8402 protein n=1 Tax=Coccomyxa viridis TaxID=1274662 RepID=A0ABP1G091_9CHLO